MAAQFRRKYPNGFMTTEEFVRENMAVQGGTREFWLEVARNFVDEGVDRIGFTDFIAGMFLNCVGRGCVRVCPFLTGGCINRPLRHHPGHEGGKA